ncbi:MAG: hypothetical protein HY903_02690 [Deltaproteobacteria bacterium]|nr:hypothetical protein [Deltaproteobacteria bacterium]
MVTGAGNDPKAGSKVGNTDLTTGRVDNETDVAGTTATGASEAKGKVGTKDAKAATFVRGEKAGLRKKLASAGAVNVTTADAFVVGGPKPKQVAAADEDDLKAVRILADINRAVRAALTRGKQAREQGRAISAADLAALKTREDALTRALTPILEAGRVSEPIALDAARSALLALARDLATLRLDDTQAWVALDHARDALIEAAAEGYGLTIEAVAKAQTYFPDEKRLVGLVIAPKRGAALSAAQAQVAFNLRSTCHALEQVRFETHYFGVNRVKLDKNGVALAGRYDEVSRRGFGLWPVTATPSISAPPGGRDIHYIGAILDRLDRAMHGNPVDFKAPLPTPDVAPVTLPSVGRVEGQPRAEDVHLPTAGNGRRPNLDLDTVGQGFVALNDVLKAGAEHAPYGLARGGAALFRTYNHNAAAADAKLPELFGGAYTVTDQDLAALNAGVGTALAGLPGGLGQTLGGAVGTGLATVQPGTTVSVADEYHLATPQVWQNGNTQILLGADSYIRKEGDAYVASGPLIRAVYGDHGEKQIIADQGTVRFGGGLDLIDFASVAFSGPDRDVAVVGAHAEVNRTAETAVIRAAEARFDFTKSGGGVTVLTNARLEQVGDTQTLLGAAAVSYVHGDTSISASDAVLVNSRDGGTETVRVGVGPVDAHLGSTSIRASEMRLQLDRTLDANGQAQANAMTIAASDVDVRSGDQHLKIGGEAKLQVVSTAAGSQVTIFTEQTDLQLPTGSFHADGPLGLVATYDAAGNIQRLDVTGNGLRYTDASGRTLTSGGTSLSVYYGADNKIDRVVGSIKDTTFVDGSRRLRLTGQGELGMVYGADGKVASISGKVGDGTLSFIDGRKTVTLNAGTEFIIAYGANGAMHHLELKNGGGSFDDGRGTWTMQGANGTIDWDQNGLFKAGTVEVGSITGLLANGSKVEGTGTKITLLANAGQLQHGELVSATFTYTDRRGAMLKAVDAKAVLDWNPDGSLAHAQTTLGRATYTGTKGETISGTGVTLDATYENGFAKTLRVKGDSLELASKQNKVTATGAQINVICDAQGGISQADFAGKTFSYSGTSPAGKETRIDVAGGMGAKLVVAADGSQAFTFNAAAGKVTSGGTVLRFDDIEKLEAKTDAAGALTAFDFGSKGLITVENTSVKGSVKDLQLSYLQGSPVTGSFTDGALEITGKGLTAQIHDANFGASTTKMWLHVGKAELEKLDLEKKLDIKGTIEGLDIVVDKATGDVLQSVTLQLQNLDVTKVSADLRLIVKCPRDGDRLAAHLGLDEQGKEFRELTLKIPEGGNLRVVARDLDATLSAGQLGVYFEPSGRWRLATQDLDLTLARAKERVKIGNLDADIWLDPEKGVVIHELSGSISATQGGKTYNLSIADIHNLALRFQEYTGDTRGFALILEPAGDGSSNLTASFATDKYSIQFENLAALTAYATITKNQATLSVGDPTRRGKVRASYETPLGKLSIESPQIGLFAQFFEPSVSKVLTETTRQLHGLMSAMTPAPVDLYQIVPGVHLQGNTLMLGRLTPGVDGNLVFRIPDAVFGEPSLSWAARDKANPSAWGLASNVGYVGEKRTLIASLGLEPYSSLRLKILGDAKLGNVPLPGELNLPTAADLSLMYGQKESDAFSWAVRAGAYASANGWDAYGVKQPVVGAHAEIGVTKKLGDAELEATLGVAKHKSADGEGQGVLLSIGLKGW